MEYRHYNSEDYEILAKWWESWGWPAIPEMALPQAEPRGVIVTNEGVDICAGFLYKTDSCTCWIENIISNKEAPKELRKGSIEYLIDTIASEAEELGFKVMMTSIKHEGLIEKFIATGCEKDYETGMSNLARIL
jgi:hypothetical protein